MEPTFECKIISDGNETLFVLAPHTIRQRIYNILELISNDKIVYFSGGNPTKISVEPYDGYPHRAALAILVAATYLAVKNAGLEEVWATSLQDHYALAPTTMNLTGIPDMFKEIDYTNFGYMVTSYVNRTAVKRLIDCKRQFSGGLSVYTEELYTWKYEVSEAYRRLKFGFPHMYNEKLATEHVKQFADAITLANSVNIEVAKILKDSDDAIELFAGDLELGEPDMIERWQYLLFKAIEHNAYRARQWKQKFNRDALVKVLNLVRQNTPPAPPAEKK